MGFPDAAKEKVLVACGRHCALCHRFCGLKIELHHIQHQSEGGGDTFENCIPLCFDCHADMRSYDHKHPKGTKYSPSELRKHRDGWYAKVQASGLPSTPATLKLDRRVFDELKTLIRVGNEIAFLRYHDFAGSFRYDKLENFDRFRNRCEDPEFEFLDPDLEGLRARLLASVERFLGFIGQYTFRQNIHTGAHGVEQDWEFKNPELLVKAVESLNSSADAIVEDYEALARACRRKFAELEV